MAQDAEMTTSAFDVQRFGRWLRRYGESESIVWTELAKASGIGSGTWYAVLAGRSPSQRGHEPGRYDPSITVCKKMADGLGLDLGYVLSKAGIETHGARVSMFSEREQVLLYRALGVAIDSASSSFFPLERERLTKLQGEFADNLRKHISTTNDVEGEDDA